jgi:hypothetical protein
MSSHSEGCYSHSQISKEFLAEFHNFLTSNVQLLKKIQTTGYTLYEHCIKSLITLVFSFFFFGWIYGNPWLIPYNVVKKIMGSGLWWVTYITAFQHASLCQNVMTYSSGTFPMTKTLLKRIWTLHSLNIQSSWFYAQFYQSCQHFCKNKVTFSCNIWFCCLPNSLIMC